MPTESDDGNYTWTEMPTIMPTESDDDGSDDDWSEMPTFAPTEVAITPTMEPTAEEPTEPPTAPPSDRPTYIPILGTDSPTVSPTESEDNGIVPTESPTTVPTAVPTVSPTQLPSQAPTATPSIAPSTVPTAAPTTSPSFTPTMAPTLFPSRIPTPQPSLSPSLLPTLTPTVTPTRTPTRLPTFTPSLSPSMTPSALPSAAPTHGPTVSPTVAPTTSPSATPTVAPTTIPTLAPTVSPTAAPSATPTISPTASPSASPTPLPTAEPTTARPSATPTIAPTSLTRFPTVVPTRLPTASPTIAPTNQAASTVTFDLQMTVSGLSSLNLTSEERYSFRATQATILKTDVKYVKYVKAYDPNDEKEKSKGKGKKGRVAKVDRLLLLDMYLLGVSGVVVTNVEVPMIDHPQYAGNVTALLTAAVQTINTAVTTGTFAQTLQTVALSLNVTTFNNITAEKVEVGNVFVQQPPTYSPTVMIRERVASPLNDGEIAGVVVGVTVGVGLVFGVIYYFYVLKKSTLQIIPNAGGSSSNAGSARSWASSIIPSVRAAFNHITGSTRRPPSPKVGVEPAGTASNPSATGAGGSSSTAVTAGANRGLILGADVEEGRGANWREESKPTTPQKVAPEKPDTKKADDEIRQPSAAKSALVARSQEVISL